MKKLIDEFRRGWQGIAQPSLLFSATFAAGCLVLSTIARWGVAQIRPDVFFTPYFPAVFLAAAVGGARVGIATAVAGGALGAIVIQFVAPDSFNVFVSITFLVGVVVGGLASISGAIFGAIFIQFIPNIADQISKAAPWAIYGIFLIGSMYLMPTGVAGALRGLARRFRGG